MKKKSTSQLQLHPFLWHMAEVMYTIAGLPGTSSNGVYPAKSTARWGCGRPHVKGSAARVVRGVSTGLVADRVADLGDARRRARTPAVVPHRARQYWRPVLAFCTGQVPAYAKPPSSVPVALIPADT
eukprot:1545061-Rhodomonas_salina.3